MEGREGVRREGKGKGEMGRGGRAKGRRERKGEIG